MKERVAGAICSFVASCAGGGRPAFAHTLRDGNGDVA